MQVNYSSDYQDWELAERICKLNEDTDKVLYFCTGIRWKGLNQPDMLFVSKRKTKKNKS